MNTNTNAFDHFLEKSSEFSAITLAFFIPISTSLTGILFILSVTTGLLTRRFRQTLALMLNSPWVKTAVLLFALFAIAISYTSAPLHDAISMLEKYSRLLLMVLFIPTFCKPNCRKYAIFAFLCAITVTLIASYLQFFGLTDIPHKFGQAAIFKDRIQTNFLMAFGFYLFSGQLINITINNRKNIIPHFRFYQIALFFLCLLTIFDILFLSDGRSGYIIFSLLFLLLAWQKFKWRGILYASGCLLLIMSCVFMLSKNFHDRMLEVHNNVKSYQQGNTETSVGLRMAFATNSIKLIAKHPLVGTGTGSFKNEYKKITPTHSMPTANPHNEYLNIGVQLGLPAIAVLLLLFYLQWHESNTLPKQYQEIAQAVVLTISIGCLGNAWLMDTTEGHFYALFMALCFASRLRIHYAD